MSNENEISSHWFAVLLQHYDYKLRCNFSWESHLSHQKGSCTRKPPSLWWASLSGYSCHNSFWCPKDPRRSVWETKKHSQTQRHSWSDVRPMHALTNEWANTDMKDMHSMYTVLLQDSPNTFPDPYTITHHFIIGPVVCHRECGLPAPLNRVQVEENCDVPKCATQI